MLNAVKRNSKRRVGRMSYEPPPGRLPGPTELRTASG
jgi:hypothetical protein